MDFGMHITVYTWKSKDNLGVGSIFHRVTLRDQTQVISHDSNCSYLLNSLVSVYAHIFKTFWLVIVFSKLYINVLFFIFFWGRILLCSTSRPWSQGIPVPPDKITGVMFYVWPNCLSCLLFLNYENKCGYERNQLPSIWTFRDIVKLSEVSCQNNHFWSQYTFLM